MRSFLGIILNLVALYALVGQRTQTPRPSLIGLNLGLHRHLCTLITMATCYYPDGSVSGGYPCWNTTSSAEYAPCCFDDAYCYSNGWCFSSASMTVYRGGCTDEKWQSDSCVKECTGGPIGGIYKCDDDGNSACYASQCGTSEQFHIPSGSLMLTGPPATSVLLASGYASSPTPPSISTVTATTTPSSPACSNTYSTGTISGVGVGIGVPLLIALAATLLLLFRERRRNKTAHSQLLPSTGKRELEGTSLPWQQTQQSQSSHYKPRHEIGLSGDMRVELPQ